MHCDAENTRQPLFVHRAILRSNLLAHGLVFRFGRLGVDKVYLGIEPGSSSEALAAVQAKSGGTHVDRQKSLPPNFLSPLRLKSSSSRSCCGLSTRFCKGTLIRPSRSGSDPRSYRRSFGTSSRGIMKMKQNALDPRASGHVHMAQPLTLASAQVKRTSKSSS